MILSNILLGQKKRLNTNFITFAGFYNNKVLLNHSFFVTEMQKNCGAYNIVLAIQ